MKGAARSAAGWLCLAAVGACGAPPPAPPAGTAAPDPGAAATAEVAAEAVRETATDRAPPTGALVIFLGDSLTAGLGLGEGEAYPALVGEILRRRGVAVQVVNGGVSGDTSAGGLSRAPWLLAQDPALVVVALGANDGLRGLPPEVTERNLEEIVRLCREAGAAVVLAGMKVPPNYGGDYAVRFEELYEGLARRAGVPLIPFLLEGVAGVPELNQEDGIHPNAAGHRRLAETVAPRVETILRSLTPPST